MSSVGLDQLFQITAPTRSVLESAPRNEVGGEQFRAHLEQASATKETEQTPQVDDTQEIEEEQQVEAQTDGQEAATTPQEESVVSDESAEISGESTEPEQQESQTEDDVTLSAEAAAVIAEGIATQEGEVAETANENTTSTTSVEASASGDQQQSTEKQILEAVQISKGDGNTDATAVLNVESSETAEATQVEDLSESAELLESFSTDGEGEEETAKSKQPVEEVLQTKAEQQVEAVAKNVVANSEGQQIVQADQQGAQLTAAELPKNEDVKTAKNRGRQAEVAKPLAVSAVTDAELLPENNGTALEVNAPTPTSSTGNEAALTADRTLGRTVQNAAVSSTNKSVETESTTTPTVDRARFVQRVGGAIRSAQQRDGQIQLRLSPPELGTLKIEIAVKSGVVTAKLETENAAARTVLLDNLPALRERLAEQEIRIEKFDVDVRREGQQQENPGADERQANQRRDQAATARQDRHSGRQSERVGAVAPTSLPTNDSGLDVRI